MAIIRKLLTVLSFVFISQAQAAYVTLDATYQGLVGGYKNLSASVNGKSKTVSVGMMNFKVNQATALPFALPGMFDAFCVEFEQQVKTGKMTYSVVPIEEKFSAPKASAITALYSKFHAATNDLIGKMAFQFALWELVYDYTADNWSKLSFGNGGFKTGSKDPAVLMASSWLGQLKGYVSLEKMYVLTSPTSQDQLIFASVAPPKDVVEDVPVSATMVVGAFLLLAGWQVQRARAANRQALPSLHA